MAKGWPGRPSIGHRRPGFVGGRHDRHSAARLLRPDRHSVRDLPRCSGVFRRHAARLHRGNGGLGGSRLRGFISLALGLTIGLVGLDSVSGQARLTLPSRLACRSCIATTSGSGI
jgi:hypothetical protein